MSPQTNKISTAGTAKVAADPRSPSAKTYAAVAALASKATQLTKAMQQAGKAVRPPQAPAAVPAPLKRAVSPNTASRAPAAKKAPAAPAAAASVEPVRQPAPVVQPVPKVLAVPSQTTIVQPEVVTQVQFPKVADDARLGHKNKDGQETIKFGTWNLTLKIILRNRGLDGALERDYLSVDPAAAMDPVEQQKVRNDSKVQEHILNSITANQKELVVNCTTAAEMYGRLEENNRARNVTTALEIREKLDNCRIKPGENVRQMAKRHRLLVEEAISLGVVFSEYELALKLLRCLPSYMNPFVQAYDARDDHENIKYETVQKAIAASRTTLRCATATDAAMSVMSSDMPLGQRICTWCQENGRNPNGHTVDYCRRKPRPKNEEDDQVVYEAPKAENFKGQRDRKNGDRRNQGWKGNQQNGRSNKKHDRRDSKKHGKNRDYRGSGSNKTTPRTFKFADRTGSQGDSGHVVWPHEAPVYPHHEEEDFWPRKKVYGEWALSVTYLGEAPQDREEVDALADSGASKTMTPYRHRLSKYRCITPFTLNSASGNDLIAIGIGFMTFGNAVVEALHVKNLTHTLLSVSQLTQDMDTSFIVRGNRAYFIGSGVRITAHRRGNLFFVKHEKPIDADWDDTALAVTMPADATDVATWHRRLGHINAKDIRLLAETPACGVRLTDAESDFTVKNCEACLAGKHNTVQSKQPARRATRRLELVHSDLSGMIASAQGGFQYYICFIDDYSRYTWVFLLKDKSSATILRTFDLFLASAERQSNERVLCLRTDGGTEYGAVMAARLEELGINRQVTTPHTPQQNGVAERLNRTLFESVRAMLAAQGVAKNLWALAVLYACWIRNRVPTSANDGEPPFKRWFGRDPDLRNARVFGARCWIKVPKAQLTKLDDRSRTAIFVGFQEGTKGWKVMLPGGRVTTSKDVVFFESANDIPRDKMQDHLIDRPWRDDDGTFAGRLGRRSNVIMANPDIPVPFANAPPSQSGGENAEPSLLEETAQSQEDAAMQQEEHEGSPAPQPMDYVDGAYSVVTRRPPPRSVSEALNRSDGYKWQLAISEEYESLNANQTWEEYSGPLERQPLPCMFVFTEKYDEFGKSIRHKARLVARGDLQKYGIDYEETFSPTVRMESQRMLLAEAAAEDMEIHQVDIKTAYLNGKLDRPIFLRLPDGRVVKLLKGLYGLKQAGRCWKQRLHEALTAYGFTCVPQDESVYVKDCNDKRKKILLTVYVDDIIICSKDIQRVEATKKMLARDFDVKDEGELHYILGLKVSRDRKKRTIKITQKAYLEQVLDHFQMSNCKPMALPELEHQTDEKRAKTPKLGPEERKEFRTGVGKLNWAVISTRPDFAYRLSVLAAAMSDPNEIDMQNLKRALRYLRGTLDVGIELGAGQLEGYSDADFASTPGAKGKSTSGFIFHMGGPISWSSKRQELVALSTTESEFMALVHAGKEARWLTALGRSMGISVPETVTLFCDNQSTIEICYNSTFHARTKHIDYRFWWIRDAIERGEFRIEYVNTKAQCADMLTKLLKGPLHGHNLYLNGMISKSPIQDHPERRLILGSPSMVEDGTPQKRGNDGNASQTKRSKAEGTGRK